MFFKKGIMWEFLYYKMEYGYMIYNIKIMDEYMYEIYFEEKSDVFFLLVVSK